VCTEISVHPEYVEGTDWNENTSFIYEGNLRAIHLVKNMQILARTKYIDIRHHYIMRDLQARGDASIIFKWSTDNTSDIVTKNSTKEIHDRNSKKIQYGRRMLNKTGLWYNTLEVLTLLPLDHKSTPTSTEVVESLVVVTESSAVENLKDKGK
jgi:hypothetical protein